MRAILILALALGGCAPGGGIGLMAIAEDAQCQQAGYKIDTPEYLQCRVWLRQNDNANIVAGAAAGAAPFIAAQQMQPPPPVNCSYRSTTTGNTTYGTGTCQ